MPTELDLFKDLGRENLSVVMNSDELHDIVFEIERDLYPLYISGDLSYDEFVELCQDKLDIKKLIEATESIAFRDKLVKTVKALIEIAKMA